MVLISTVEKGCIRNEWVKEENCIIMGDFNTHVNVSQIKNDKLEKLCSSFNPNNLICDIV